MLWRWMLEYPNTEYSRKMPTPQEIHINEIIDAFCVKDYILLSSFMKMQIIGW